MIVINKKNKKYIVATIKSWNIELFHRLTPSFEGSWHLITEKHQLTENIVNQIQPDYVFFPHWSWIVPNNIVENHDCVCFHMSDVPYGRGGSPLQNLIVRGHTATKLTALRMTNDLDAGPIYCKKDLALTGSAQKIYENAAELSYELIQFIAANTPTPYEQTGEITVFERRTPEQSEFSGDIIPSDLYDLIRMLDAETYPHAYSILNKYKLEFTGASIDGDTITATTTFKRIEHADE